MRRLVAAILSMFCWLSVRADVVAVPPRETGEQVTKARLVDGQLELRDARTDDPIVATRGMLIAESPDPDVRASIDLRPQPSGADLVITLQNTGDQPAPAGHIALGVMTLGKRVTFENLRSGCRAQTLEAAATQPFGSAYPGETYSPVIVLRNDKMAISVSLLYPVLEYEHDVHVGISSPAGRMLSGVGGRGWAARFQLSNAGAPTHARIAHDAVLWPGETRTYVLSVRVTMQPELWMRTLLPYRAFFRSTYGGVQYERRSTPVSQMTLAQPWLASDDSPFGYDASARIDRLGWKPVIDRLVHADPDTTVMLRHPTGVYAAKDAPGAPFRFTTPWLDRAATANVGDQSAGLAAVAAAGRPLGLWWGNAAEIHRGWDSPQVEAFDPAEPEHVQLALAEMDLAARVGATTVVLGGFTHDQFPVWHSMPWIKTLRNRYPQIRFVTDPAACDLLHATAPTIVRATSESPQSEAAIVALTGPHDLADFLLPGHETWALLDYAGAEKTLKLDVAPDRMESDATRISGFGFIPMIDRFISGVELGRSEESWQRSVPKELWLDARGRTEKLLSLKPIIEPTPSTKTAKGAKGKAKPVPRPSRVDVRVQPRAEASEEEATDDSAASEAIRRMHAPVPNSTVKYRVKPGDPK